MIPKSAVKAYLNRPLDSHLWIKHLKRPQLLATVLKLHPRPQLHPDLRLHQIACFVLGVAYPQFAFWLDMGSGKTLLALELLQYWQQCGKLRKALIFITSDKAFPTWEKQIKRFNIDLPYALLEGSSIEKWRQYDTIDRGLVFISYPGAVALVSKAVKVKRKTKWKLDPKLVRRFGEDIDAIVMDESTRVSGHTSLAHELASILGETAHIRYALAGRPFGRDPTLLWAQHMLVDGGETLGTTLGLFREAFFTSEPNPWVPEKRQKYIRDYKFKKSMMPQLSRMIQHRSINYSADECIDMPSWVPIIEEVKFPEEAEAYYRRAVQTLIEAKGNWRVIKNVFLRLRQISSGFVGFKNDETGEKAEVEFDENPKLDRLLELLDQMPDDCKAVCFYEYTLSGRKIAAATQVLGLKPIWLWSGTKDFRGDLRRFETNPACRLAVVNNKVGAFSLDGLQVANYCFFFESPVSVIDREQAERRLRRQGQVRKVLQYDLVVRGSVEGKILAYHKEGEGLMEVLRRNPLILKDDGDGNAKKAA